MDDRVPEHRDSHASSSHEPSLEPKPATSADLGKQCLPEDQNHKGPVQKTHWWSRTSCRKIDDFITADHKVLSEELGHPMDPVLYVQNKNFTGNSENLAEVLGAEQEASCHLH